MFIECAIWEAIKALLGITDDEIETESMSPLGIVAFINRRNLKEITINVDAQEVYIYYKDFINGSDIGPLNKLGIFTIHPIKEDDGDDLDYYYRKPHIKDGIYIKMTWR